MSDICWNCNNDLKGAVPIRSQFIRVCVHCLKENKWMLDQGQNPVGYNLDQEMLTGYITEVGKTKEGKKGITSNSSKGEIELQINQEDLKKFRDFTRHLEEVFSECTKDLYKTKEIEDEI